MAAEMYLKQDQLKLSHKTSHLSSRNISASIALSRYEYLIFFNAKDIFEVLEELDEVLRRLFLSGGLWGTCRISSADWLIDPQHIGQVHLSRISC